MFGNIVIVVKCSGVLRKGVVGRIRRGGGGRVGWGRGGGFKLVWSGWWGKYYWVVDI